MATSEIFPIFQRTKRPMGPTASAASVQRSSEGRPAAQPATARPRPTAASRTAQRPSVGVQRTRASNTAARRAESALTRPATPPRSGSDNRDRGGRVTAQVQMPSPLPLRSPRSVDVLHAERQARSTSPARAERSDRPARRFFLCFGLALLAFALGVFALAFLGVLPARTYFGQQDELVQKKARLVMLGERNSLLGNRVASLQSDQVVARIARDQFGMVAPGDTLTVLPGLRDESLSLNGDASNVVTAVPPADVAADPALLSSLLNWIRQIVG